MDPHSDSNTNTMWSFFKKKNAPEIPNYKAFIANVETCMTQQDYEQVIKLAQAAVKELTRVAPEAYLALGTANFWWGRAALNAERFVEAENPLLRSLNAYEKAKTGNPEESLIAVYMALSEVWMANKRYVDALNLLSKLEAQLSSIAPSLLHLKVYLFSGQIKEVLRKYDEAIAYYNQYLKMLVPLRGKEESNYHFISQHKSKLEACLEAKKAGFPNPLISIKYENESRAVLDATYAQYLVSELPQPSQSSLDKIFQGAVMFQLVKAVGRNGKEHILFEENERETIRLFGQKMKIQADQEFGHLMCHGHAWLRLRQSSGEEIMIEFLNTDTIRWLNGWKEDAQLEDSPFLKKWLEDKGAFFQ